MFKSYFITGLRNLLKQKGYSFIKIIGLAFGLTASMIIYLYVAEDLSYDTFIPTTHALFVFSPLIVQRA
jgi:putative ABC transport system permease protein